MLGMLKDSSWVAIQVRVRREELVASQLQMRGYEHFLPTFDQKLRRGNQIQMRKGPLFPGYLFCKFNAAAPLRIVTIPGVVRILGIPGKPHYLADKEIDEIRKIVVSGAVRGVLPKLEIGRPMLIVNGPLAGISGVLSTVRKHRLLISVTVLKRSIMVQMGPDDLAPIS
jgi:transcription antitermination factor NusG